MTNGDIALAAGIDIIDPSTHLVKDGAAAINYALDVIAERTDDVTPVAKGGTGATNVAGARSNLSVPHDDTGSSLRLYSPAFGQLWYEIPGVAFPTRFARGDEISTLDSEKRDVTDGGFGSTPIYTPHGRANPVTSSYVSAWLNVDGRIGASASSAKYKKDIGDYDGEILDLQPRVFRFKDDPIGTLRIGLIAEEVNEIEPMLVRHEDGEPEGVHYEFIAVALLREVQRLAARVAQLEARNAPD